MKQLKKEAKKKLGIGYQKKIAKLTGIHKNTINSYFSGKNKISHQRYKLIAKSIGLDVFLGKKITQDEIFAIKEF